MTGPVFKTLAGTTYPFPAQARERPNPCEVSQLRKPWAQCHGLMGHQTIADSQHDAYAQHRGQCPVHQEGSAMGAMPWLVAMELDLMEEASNTPKPWAPRHGMGSHISVGKAHWCTSHLVSWLVHATWLRRPWSKTRWWTPGHKKHLVGKEAAC